MNDSVHNGMDVAMHDFKTAMGMMNLHAGGTMKSWSGFMGEALASSVLDAKTKELIALALAVAAHCDACIGFHVKALVKLGATQQEVEETLGMCVYMGGGPSLMYTANALAAFKEFTAQA